MPQFYRPPLGIPLNWRDEQSGELVAAVEAYLDHAISGATIRDEQITLLRDFIVYYIDAPCWTKASGDVFGSELAILRSTARELDSATEIGEWINKAMEIGMDPL